MRHSMLRNFKVSVYFYSMFTHGVRGRQSGWGTGTQDGRRAGREAALWAAGCLDSYTLGRQSRDTSCKFKFKVYDDCGAALSALHA